MNFLMANEAPTFTDTERLDFIASGCCVRQSILVQDGEQIESWTAEHFSIGITIAKPDIRAAIDTMLTEYRKRLS